MGVGSKFSRYNHARAEYSTSVLEVWHDWAIPNGCVHYSCILLCRAYTVATFIGKGVCGKRRYIIVRESYIFTKGYHHLRTFPCESDNSSGVTRLLLMPGQATYSCSTHIHTCPSSYGHQYSFQNILYWLFCMQDIYPSYSNDQSSGVRTIQTDTGSSCALIPDLSSTWINAQGAYNTSRDACLNCLTNYKHKMVNADWKQIPHTLKYPLQSG